MADPVGISSGQLDRVVVLQRRVDPPAKDALGGPIEQWIDLATVPAQKLDMRGSESVRADEVAAKGMASFVIRYTGFSPMLNSRDRLLYNPDPRLPAASGLTYNITDVREIGRRVGHVLDVQARTDQLPGA